MSMCLMPLNCTLKMAKMVILLCIFCHNKIFKVQKNEKLNFDKLYHNVLPSWGSDNLGKYNISPHDTHSSSI